MENVHHLLQQVTMTTKREIPNHYLAGNPRDSDGKQAHDVCSIQASLINETVSLYLFLEMSKCLYKLLARLSTITSNYLN